MTANDLFVRPLASLAVAAVLALAAPSHGAPLTPQITDPTGDAMPPVSSGMDVVSALFRTEGTTAKVRGRKVYTPSKLIVTMTYAGDVPADDTVAQVVAFDVPGCENVYLERYGADVTYGAAGCLEDSFSFNAKVSGKTITFTVPFATIGKAYLKAGATLTNLRTYTAFSEPVFGFETADFVPVSAVGTVDDATTAATFRL